MVMGIERRLGRPEQELGERRPGMNVDLVVEFSGRPGYILLGSLAEKWLPPGVSEMWGVPGRDIDFGETFHAAVERYTLGELGCKGKYAQFIGVGENFEAGNHYIGIQFAVTIDEEPRVMTPEDWEEWRWFALDELPQELSTPARNLITCYQEAKITASF